VIALDTNVLVRFLVEDDPRQAQIVRDLVRSVIESGSRCFLSDLVLAEMVWVLERRYKVPRTEIVEKLEQLLRSRHLEFQSRDWIDRATRAYKAMRGDFADFLIREAALGADCAAVATFDRALHSQPGFLSPEQATNE
jgi:predicted nucleic-acid-binding protein